MDTQWTDWFATIVAAWRPRSRYCAEMGGRSGCMAARGATAGDHSGCLAAFTSFGCSRCPLGCLKVAHVVSAAAAHVVVGSQVCVVVSRNHVEGSRCLQLTITVSRCLHADHTSCELFTEDTYKFGPSPLARALSHLDTGASPVRRTPSTP